MMSMPLRSEIASKSGMDPAPYLEGFASPATEACRPGTPPAGSGGAATRKN